MQEIEHKKGRIYYTMGEVAEMFDVNPSLLRYWEQEFDILKPHRNKKGNRLFTPKDVDNIRIIYHLLKERKMKIEVARKYIKDHRKEVDRDAEITERLMGIRALLLEIKQDLAYGGDTVEDEEEFSPTENAPDIFGTEIGEGAAMPPPLKKGSRKPEPRNSAPEADENTSAQAASPTDAKPPFEEQVLFDIAVPLELTQDSGTVGDEGFESAKAAFTGQAAPREETPEEQLFTSNAIEQTLF